MNMNSPPGQMCKWLGDRRKPPPSTLDRGGIWNSHHNVSIYSCWKFTLAYFIMWYRTAEWAPSAPIIKSKGTSISVALLLKSVSLVESRCSNHASFLLKSAPVSLLLNRTLTLGKFSRWSRSRLLRPARSIARIDYQRILEACHLAQANLDMKVPTRP